MPTKKDLKVSFDHLAEGAKTPRHKAIVSIKSRAAMKRTWLQKVADGLANGFGTTTFLMVNALAFGVWVFFNVGLVEGVTPFDPFPFNLLTMAVSLEAIFLSIIVLISQNRAAKTEELRQELDLQLNLIAEQEITKIMGMLTKIMKNHKMDVSGDKVLAQMLKPTNTEKLEEELEKQM